MSYVEKGIDRITPSSLKLIAVPMLTLVIVVPVTLITVGPLGAILGNYLSVGVNDLFNHAGIAAMILLAGTFSLIIMTGMHYALVPIMINNIAQNGHDYILPAMFWRTWGRRVICGFLEIKNKTFKSLAFTTSITALMGITEPAMYGVNMRLKTVRGCINRRRGRRCFYGVTGVASYIVGGNAGLPSIPVFIGRFFTR